jgi:predicted patatin/cPLA2 family phospholipase
MNGGYIMRYYAEMTVEEAMKKCGRNARVLVAVQNLENNNEDDIIFTKKKREEYNELFENIKTVASIYDDFVKQLNLFTEKQDIYDIKPKGIQKIILLKE